jgi:hypothetical protein
MNTAFLFTTYNHRLLGKSGFLFASFMVLCFALSQTARAVTPPPDGGYPGDNTAEGEGALFSLPDPLAGGGRFNTAIGERALYLNMSGNYNTAIGHRTFYMNVNDSHNTAIGAQALHNTTGTANTAYGAGALLYNTTGQNTAIGYRTLYNNTTGNNNVALGSSAGTNAATGSNNIYVGTPGVSGVAGENNACYIASIFNQTSASGIPVLINSHHKLGTTTSSKRFKENITPMDNASETLFALIPVSFRYKKEIDPGSTSQFGLVAEDVENVNPDLVVRDTEGKPYTVRYDQVNAMLLNEFLKEHRKVEQLKKDFESKIAEQQKQIEALTAGLQKLSAELDLSRIAPQTVLNN